MSETYRQESRKDWSHHNSGPTTDDLKVGCLQRIADATEKMAGNYNSLINERDNYKRWYEQERKMSALRLRQIAALHGVITKLHKKLER